MSRVMAWGWRWAAALVVVSLGLVPGAWAKGPRGHGAKASKQVRYEGKLQGADRKPIGGIYPLTFSFFRSARGGRPLWSESHFVAVDDGRYVVQLGKKRPIRATVNLDRVYVGVALTGGEEIVREPLRPAPEPPPQVAAPSAGAPSAAPVTAAPTKGADGRLVVDYAETAGEAYEAHHAKVADKLGSLTAEDVQEKLKRTGGKATLGKKKHFSASAGGDGGTHYELLCPPGYVVTGVRGGGGIYLDSIKLICQPLE